MHRHPITRQRRPSLRRRGEQGFTLVELLVTILIIGILAALAIPLLTGQQSKAYDASAKALAQTAQTAAETYASENGGDYQWGNNKKGTTALHTIEPAINITNEAEAELTTAKEVAKGAGYEVTVTAGDTGVEFTVKRNAQGDIEHTCKSPTSKTGCSGAKSGTW